VKWPALRKQDWILFGVGIIGVIFISVCDYILWFDLSADAKFNSIILWVTAIVVIKYTIETYDLRKTTEKEVKIQEEIMRNEFLPIITPVEKDAIIQDSTFRMYIANVGKGIARDVELQMHGLILAKGYTVKAGQNDFLISGEDRNISAITQAESPPTEMDAVILYKDIYGRHFRTVGLKFILDEDDRNTRYTLNITKWAYKIRSN